MTQPTPSSCFHCAEPIPPGTRIYAQLPTGQAAMCCEGCRAVAELIAGVGLSDYYQYRSQPAFKPEPRDKAEWQRYDSPEIAAQFVHEESPGQLVTNLLVAGLRCAACSWLIERCLTRLPGIVSARVNLATGRLRVVWCAGQLQLVDLLRALSDLGYPSQPVNADNVLLHRQQERRTALRRLGVAGLGMMQVMMYVLPLYVREQTRMEDSVQHYLQLISLLLTTPVLFYSGWPFLNSATRALRNRSINMDVPVALALSLAYGASVYNTLRGAGEIWFDSVTMFVFLLGLGRYVEMTLRHRSGSRSDALARLQPVSAQRRTGNDGEHWQETPIKQLQPGDEILVRAGAALPADGVIVSGTSMLDESLLTGESLPQMRTQSERVLAGTINVEAPLRVRITALGSATVLSGVLALLEKAQADKPRLALAADRIARYFLQILIALSVMVGLVWWRIDPERAFEAVLAVLVVSCPCALSLATPAVIAAASTTLARRGLLVTHADAIERLAQLERVVFDKTGTLSTGRISISGTQSLASLSAERCLQIAAAMELGAEHPIARAFQAEALKRTLPAANLAHQVKVIPGAGVQAEIDGVTYRLGRAAYVAALCGAGFEDHDASIVLGDAQQLLARFTLQDPLRSEARDAIRQLQRLGVHSSMLSGDAESAVQFVAQACGIERYQSRCQPSDKLSALQHYQQTEHVAMVGDGINDAPVLSAADVSIAMGAGSGLAQASADAVLLSNSLSTLPYAIMLARHAHRIMHQNLWWAAFYNVVSIPLAAAGMVPPWLAAIGMSLSSMLVVLNAARLLHTSPEQARQLATTYCPIQPAVNPS